MTRIQLRRGDAAEWTSQNPTLAAGEAGLELDTGKFKFGDGTTAWADLPYRGGGPAFSPHGRRPTNPANAVWTLTLTGEPDGGTFTLLISVDGADPVETDPIDWNEVNLDDPNPSVTSIIESVTGAGTVQVDGGPLPDLMTLTFQNDLALTPVEITVGDNSLTGGTGPSVSLVQITEGGPGDTGYPEGTGWWNDDDSEAWVNNGDEETPDWRTLLANLPGSDPGVSGRLWSDAGIVSISGADPGARWAEYNGDPVTIADQDVANLTLNDLGDGSPLLDLTDPELPTVITAGIYAITAIVRSGPLTPGGCYDVTLHLDADDHDAIAHVMSSSGDGSADVHCSPSCTFYIPAGGQIKTRVMNLDGAASRDITLEEMIVQRLA